MFFFPHLFLFFQVSIKGIFQIIFILFSIDSIIGILSITTDSVVSI